MTVVSCKRAKCVAGVNTNGHLRCDAIGDCLNETIPAACSSTAYVNEDFCEIKSVQTVAPRLKLSHLSA